MIKLVVDSNIVFSAILNTDSRIGQILLTGNDQYEFYAPSCLRNEILQYQEKIKRLTKLDGDGFINVFDFVLKNIIVLDHSIVDHGCYTKAFDLCKEIDPDDTPFVAFANFLQCNLWTGDKKLIQGLLERQFKQVITTEKMFQDFLKRSGKNQAK